MRNSEDEAWSMWEMGKALGVSFVGKEKGVIERLVSLENRDRGEFESACAKKKRWTLVEGPSGAEE